MNHRVSLRNLTDLSPITPNETRWTAKYEMVKRFNTIRDELIDVADDEDCDLEIDTSLQFKRIALRCEKQLGQMNAVTTELQKEHLSLSECRLAIDSLSECVKNDRDILGNPFYRTKFTGCYVSSNGRLSPN